MFMYRFKQFIWAISACLEKVDDNILHRYLNENELDVFKKLQISEQHHSIRVCKDALVESNSLVNIDREKLAKAALLHDIGKIEKKLTVIDKSLIVALDRITKGHLRRYTFIKKIDIYYNHPQKATKILKNLGTYDSEFLEIIEKHHYQHIGNNNYLKIIKKCDDNN